MSAFEEWFKKVHPFKPDRDAAMKEDVRKAYSAGADEQLKLLTPYLLHKNDCAKVASRRGFPHAGATPCDCGLDAATQAINQPTGEKDDSRKTQAR